jgi:hypothetical protein
MNRCTHVGALLTVLSLVACGGEGTESAAPDTAKSSKELKDLTADEVRTECLSLASRITLSKEDSCEFAGLLSVPFGQTCDKVKADCMKAAEQGSPPAGAEANCLPPTEQRAGCTATVAEYELCLIAQTETIRSLSCTSELSTLNTLPSDCDAVGRKCPRLLGIGQGEGGGGQGGSAAP